MFIIFNLKFQSKNIDYKMLKCDFCKKGRAVVKLRYMQKFACGKCLTRIIDRRISRNIRSNKLLDKSDRIAVAISGGKDSTLNLYKMTEYKNKIPGMEIVAISIDEGIKGYRDLSLKIVKENVKKLGVEHKVYSLKKGFGFSVDQVSKVADRTPYTICTFCGVLRRRLLNKKARELGCNKLATGHNLDDEAQSMLMNVIRGDMKTMARLGPKSPKAEGLVQRIKILRDVPEREIAIYNVVNQIPCHFDQCPHAKGLRIFIREKLNKIEQYRPGSKFSIVRGVTPLLPLIRETIKGRKMYRCKKCKEPSSKPICKVCSLLETLRNSF